MGFMSKLVNFFKSPWTRKKKSQPEPISIRSEIIDTSPKISAIVLSYNGEVYLKNRIESILQQTKAPYEILILDDASTDTSLEIVKDLLKSTTIPYRIIENFNNIGCGAQIIKGIQEATGDYVWFCEQDDVSKPEFLKTMLNYLTEDVNVAYCRSIPVNDQLEELPYYYSPSDIIGEDYEILGTEEVALRLCIKNTIQNFSAVLFRKSALQGIEDVIPKCKVFYDWLIYVYALQQGKIAYCSNILNFHMRHSGSIIAEQRNTQSFYEDIFEVKEFIIEHYSIENDQLKNMIYSIDHAYRPVGCEGFKSKELKEHPVLGPRFIQFQKQVYMMTHPY